MSAQLLHEFKARRPWQRIHPERSPESLKLLNRFLVTRRLPLSGIVEVSDRRLTPGKICDDEPPGQPLVRSCGQRNDADHDIRA
jgi:hypothetical protein